MSYEGIYCTVCSFSYCMASCSIVLVMKWVMGEYQTRVRWLCLFSHSKS